MNIRTTLTWTLLLGCLCSVVAFSTACDGDSAEGIVRNVGLIVEGYYTHPSGMLVSDTSGADVISMNLRQSGDQLEGIDNNSVVFRGTIGQVVDNSNASFTLNGKSTSGANATISGTIAVSGTQATMSGTWIEDSLYGTVYGQATVPTNAPPSSSTGVSISPSNTQIPVGNTRQFTVSGGTPPYDWVVSDQSIGTISGSGTTATYTALTAGINTITVGDNENRTDQATVQSTATSTGGTTTPQIPG